jgi:hypothetical protein
MGHYYRSAASPHCETSSEEDRSPIPESIQAGWLVWGLCMLPVPPHPVRAPSTQQHSCATGRVATTPTTQSHGIRYPAVASYRCDTAGTDPHRHDPCRRRPRPHRPRPSADPWRTYARNPSSTRPRPRLLAMRKCSETLFPLWGHFCDSSSYIVMPCAVVRLPNYCRRHATRGAGEIAAVDVGLTVRRRCAQHAPLGTPAQSPTAKAILATPKAW